MEDVKLFILKATPADAPALAIIINDAYRNKENRGWTTEADFFEGNRISAEALITTMEQPGSAIFKCCDETGKPLANVLLEIKNEALYLGLLAITPDAQNMGIGRIMLDYADEYAKANHCKVIDITVVNIRYELIDWYKRRGFVETGRQHAFPPAGGKLLVDLCLIEMQKPVV